MDGIDALTARFQSATISSKSKEKEKKLPEVNENRRKGALSKVSNRLLSLTQRIGIGAVPKMVAAENIDHESHEGRNVFYEQVCYLLRSKVPQHQFKSGV